MRKLIYNPSEILTTDVVLGHFKGRPITKRMAIYGLFFFIIAMSLIFLSTKLFPIVPYPELPSMISEEQMIDDLGLMEYKIRDMIKSESVDYEKRIVDGEEIVFMDKMQVLDYNSRGASWYDYANYSAPRVVVFLFVVFPPMFKLSQHQNNGQYLEQQLKNRMVNKMKNSVVFNSKTSLAKTFNKKEYR